MIYSNKAIEKLSERTGHNESSWIQQFTDLDDSYGFVTIGDDLYPYLDDGNGKQIELKYTTKRDEYQTKIPNKKGAPEFLFYRGDISLLNRESYYKNVAVIGLINPTKEIENRERDFVGILVDSGINIVSGLALGCDSIAHSVCLEHGGKTIAVLPSRLDGIIPRENTELANRIVENGGLLVTEYYDDPSPADRWATANRFIERDRLQAYFSSSIILTASYRHPNTKKGEQPYPMDGIKRDSGSRHAIKAAAAIGRRRYVMYNPATDKENDMFDLNKDLLSEKKNPVQTLTQKSINEIISSKPNTTLTLFDI